MREIVNLGVPVIGADFLPTMNTEVLEGSVVEEGVLISPTSRSVPRGIHRLTATGSSLHCGMVVWIGVKTHTKSVRE